MAGIRYDFEYGRRRGFLYEFKKNKVLFLMLLPGMVVLVLNNYLPMFGAVVAFKNFKFSSGNFFTSLFQSEWCGFKNFEFLFSTNDAYLITRNTLLYNTAFIFFGLALSVSLAIVLSELRSRKLARFFQGAMFLPYFLSWVVASYLVYAFFSFDTGFINNSVLKPLGIAPITFYSETRWWPFILIFTHLWKWTGYNCTVYLAAIMSFDQEHYEAAIIDGANKWQQITRITIPQLAPVMIVITLLNIGRIFYADFGLFYHIPRNTGMLYPVTNVIDTYVYNALIRMSDIGMSSAANLYQALVGLILVLVSNLLIRRRSPENSLF